MNVNKKIENKRATVIFFNDWVGFVIIISIFFITIPCAIIVSFFSSFQQASIFYINFIIYNFLFVCVSLAISEFSKLLLLGIRKSKIVRVLLGKQNLPKLLISNQNTQTQIVTINSKVFIKRWFSFFVYSFALTMTFRFFPGDFVEGVFLLFSSIVIFPFYRTYYI
ncbi:hypothetical protein LCGC14_1412760, partial [marine sediment metagenome]